MSQADNSVTGGPIDQPAGRAAFKLSLEGVNETGRRMLRRPMELKETRT